MAALTSHPLIRPRRRSRNLRFHAASAFTTISSRRDLGLPPRPPPLAPPPPASQQKPKITWPPSVRRWVSRAFAEENIVQGISRDEIAIRIRQLVEPAAEAQTIYNIDWDTYVLPQQLILQERAARAPQFVRPLQESNLSRTTDKPNPKKRHSSELDDDDGVGSNGAIPPWRKADTNRNAFDETPPVPSKSSKKKEKRLKRFHEEAAAIRDSSKFSGDLERRRQRFESSYAASEGPNLACMEDTPMLDAPPGPLVGTCSNLEKSYLRLTSAPKAENVRPVPILKQTLVLLKDKWRTEKNYGYVCDQFKSLRQDLTVQHIRNEFTVNAYETHARVALEKGDLGEYNQCQSQLRALYNQSLGGHPAEFLAYRIIYLMYTRNQTDMNDVLKDLTSADRDEPAVRNALKARSALALGNYYRFFQLYLEAPNLGGYLMDMFVERERLAALAGICRT